VSRRVDLRLRLGPARSQGERSTCLAFAVSAAHETALFEDHDLLDLCEEYLYWAAKQHDTPGPGTTFVAICDGMVAYGQPLEVRWPYDGHRDDQAASYQPPAAAHNAQPRWSSPLLAVPATPQSVRTQLDGGRTVVLGLPTWPELDTPTAGRLVVPDRGDFDGAHHAVAVVGYDDTTAEMLIRNSWGSTWGDDGAAWLPFSFLDRHVCETWIVDPTAAPAATTQAATAAPRYGERRPVEE
jgi:hypothetical protein